MERYGGGAIEVRDYDPRWPVLFDEECERLRGVFGPTVTIEHMGSTSVPGLAAKPIIDLLIGVQSLRPSEVHLHRAASSTALHLYTRI